MKKIGIGVLLVLMVITLLGCTNDETDTNDAANIDTKSYFTEFGLTEEYYNSTKSLVETYYSNDFKNKVALIFVDYGKDNYDSDKVGHEVDSLESEIKLAYYDIFEKCTTSDDKDMVLFGYNHSLLCLLDYRLAAMTGNPAYTDSIENYYNDFSALSNTDVFDNFCLYITKNNIMNYMTTITKMTPSDVADIVKIDCDLFNINILLTTTYINNKDMTSMFDSYSDAMENLTSIINTLQDHKDCISDFTSKDLEVMETLISDSTYCCENLSNAYTKGDNVNIALYADNMATYVEEVESFINEISENVKRLSIQ